MSAEVLALSMAEDAAGQDNLWDSPKKVKEAMNTQRINSPKKHATFAKEHRSFISRLVWAVVYSESRILSPSVIWPYHHCRGVFTSELRISWRKEDSSGLLKKRV